MNQAEVTKLMSKLKIKVNPQKRSLKNPDGPEGRLLKIRKTLTALVKYERVELNFQRADETRGYAERLISDAIRHGDCHRATMELADYFLLEKQLVHKLFKVLVPRFENCPVSYTRMFRAPKPYPGHPRERAVLELRGNPFPSLIPDTTANRSLIHNVLLDEAKKEFRLEKYAEITKSIGLSEANVVNTDSAASVGQEENLKRSADVSSLETIASDDSSEKADAVESGTSHPTTSEVEPEHTSVNKTKPKQ